MFSPFHLPQGITLLITDALSAPANFFLHRTLAAYLKKDRKDLASAKCIILSVSEDITRWKAIAAKSVNYHSLSCPSAFTENASFLEFQFSTMSRLGICRVRRCACSCPTILGWT